MGAPSLGQTWLGEFRRVPSGRRAASTLHGGVQPWNPAATYRRRAGADHSFAGHQATRTSAGKVPGQKPSSLLSWIRFSSTVITVPPSTPVPLTALTNWL